MNQRVPDSENVKISKYLTQILRHRATKMGYNIDASGYVPIDEIIKKRNDITFEKIQEIVDTNDKKRFELEKRLNGWYIRAVQGHSIPTINPDLYLVTDPSEIPVVVHGTNRKAYQSIKNNGLSRMQRNHIHFAHGTPDDPTVVSGMRHSSEVMIYINVDEAMINGIKFYKSSNGVILSSGINGIIDPKYFLKVEFVK